MAKKPKSKKVRLLRYFTQGAVFIFIMQLVIRHALTPEDQFVASAEAFCPLGGLEALYHYIAFGTPISHIHLSNIVIFAALILTILITRSAFCGWLCPFGSLQDWIRNLAIKLNIFPKLNLIQKLGKWDAILQYIKYGVLVWIIISTILTGTLVFRDADPYASLITITSLNVTVGLILLAIVIIASVFVKRPWCRYACPLGATIGLLSKLSFIKLKRDTDLCKECNLCSKACPSNIQVSKETTISQASCISCLNCIEACPINGAIKLTGPSFLTKKEKHKIKLGLNKYIYIILVIILFFGTIEVAKYFGYWSTSGKYTQTGEKIEATGANPDEIKGWMTLEEVATAYHISIEDIKTHFKLPKDIDSKQQIKDLEEAGENFSPIELRAWITERLANK